MSTIARNDSTRQEPEDSFEVRAIVETYEDRPDECTLYPVTVPEEDRLTTWITATDGSFVDRWSMR